MTFTLRLLLLSAAGLVACGGSTQAPLPTPVAQCREVPLAFTGTPGVPVPAVMEANLFGVSGTVNGADGGFFIVDTGAPVTLVNSPAFPPGSVPDAGALVTAQLDTLGLQFQNKAVVTTQLDLTLAGGPVGGLIGGDLLCHFPSSFNYRDAQVTLGPVTLPMAVGPTTTVPVTVEGGGQGVLPDGTTTLDFTSTRVSVVVNVEGTDRNFVVDTGASFTLVTSALFTELISDGRPSVSGLSATTVMGMTMTRATRVRSMSVGNAEVLNVVVGDVGGTLLASLAREVGHPVDGLLGGTYLREFFVTVDYATSQLRLSRYVTQAHVLDEFHRVGLRLGLATQPSVSRYIVATVVNGTDAAAKGIAAGEPVFAVDGQDLSAISAIQADALLHGSVGVRKAITFEGRIEQLRVDELLPPP